MVAGPVLFLVKTNSSEVSKLLVILFSLLFQNYTL